MPKPKRLPVSEPMEYIFYCREIHGDYKTLITESSIVKFFLSQADVSLHR